MIKDFLFYENTISATVGLQYACLQMAMLSKSRRATYETSYEDASKSNFND